MLAARGRHTLATSLRLIDFGLARRLDDVAHGLAGISGTKPYMAPEIFRERHGNLQGHCILFFFRGGLGFCSASADFQASSGMRNLEHFDGDLGVLQCARRSSGPLFS